MPIEAPGLSEAGQLTDYVCVQVGGPSRGTRFRPLSLDLPKVPHPSSLQAPTQSTPLRGYYALNLPTAWLARPVLTTVAAAVRGGRPPADLASAVRDRKGAVHQGGHPDRLLRRVGLCPFHPPMERRVCRAQDQLPT